MREIPVALKTPIDAISIITIKRSMVQEFSNIFSLDFLLVLWHCDIPFTTQFVRKFVVARLVFSPLNIGQ